jgi:protein-S-isoprenylcysteine O-methyltransferase Ste14
VSVWWALKVGVGLALVLQPPVAMAADLPPLIPPRLDLGAGVAAVGCLVHLGHYVLLRRRAGDLDRPRGLVTEGGLLPWVRHPMYSGDGLAMLGFLLLWPTVLALGLTAVGWLAVVQQARREDAQLAGAFPDAHAAWKRRSRLLVPFLA